MNRRFSSKLGLLGGAVALASAFVVSSANAADGTGTATATVITPITITPTADLAFGRFAANTGGTVVISTAGARSATGTVALSTVGSTQNAATFDIAGDANATYSITLPGSAATITSGANNMSVDTFTSSPTPTGTLSGGGAQTISVGGTLTVASGQAAGDYTGTFTVTVEYN